MDVTTELIAGDCVQLLKKTEVDSIDLVVTSPPYNVDLGHNKFNKNPYDLYADNKEHSTYLAWMGEIFCLLSAAVKPGGRMAVVVGDGKNGKVPTGSDLIRVADDHGWLPMANIVWLKNHRANGCAWGSWMSPSSPSFPMNREAILIFAKGGYKLRAKGQTDLTKEEFLKFASAEWTIAPERRAKQIGHPAPFPEEIPYRLIKMLSWVGATVMDPFVGSGTTALVARKLNRSCVGFDISPEYIEIAKNRLQTFFQEEKK